MDISLYTDIYSKREREERDILLGDYYAYSLVKANF